MFFGQVSVCVSRAGSSISASGAECALTANPSVCPSYLGIFLSVSSSKAAFLFLAFCCGPGRHHEVQDSKGHFILQRVTARRDITSRMRSQVFRLNIPLDTQTGWLCSLQSSGSILCLMQINQSFSLGCPSQAMSTQSISSRRGWAQPHCQVRTAGQAWIPAPRQHLCFSWSAYLTGMPSCKNPVVVLLPPT